MEKLGITVAEDLIENCVFDYMMSGEESMVCETMAAFSQQCQHQQNIIVEYSSETFCRQYQSLFYH